MKRTDFKKHAAALMLGLVLLAACALPTFATSANIKLTDGHGNPNTGSIHINLYDSTNNKALSGGELTVYRVAEVQRKNGNLSFEYCGDFDGCAIELGDLTDSTLASQLQEFLPANAEGIVQAVSNDGNVVFDDLELGLYLVVQTKASNGYKPVNSFLVSLPMAEDGQWNYEVDASPKVGAYTPEPETPPSPPDTPDKPDKPDTPDTPENPDNPDNPVAPGTPDNPVAPGSPDNPVLPGHPNNPVMNGLPQTGQLNWPIPVLTAAGTCLIAAGILLRKKH